MAKQLPHLYLQLREIWLRKQNSAATLHCHEYQGDWHLILFQVACDLLADVFRKLSLIFQQDRKKL